MLPTINLGPFVIPTAGLVYILSAWAFLSTVERAAKKRQLAVNSIYNLGAVMLVGGVLGARLFFVILHWSAYSRNLVGIVWPITSGYDFAAGLLVGLAAAFFYGRWKRLSFWPVLDALVPGFVVGLLGISLADFLAGPGYGDRTAVPWAIDVFGIQRHPVQLYEILVALLALGFWLWLARREQVAGVPALVAAAIYSAGRLFVDAFRANTPLTEGGFHFIQMFTLAVLLLALYFAGLLSSRAASGPASDHAEDAG